MDFGVSSADYCSDLQRVWYFLDEGETAPPDDVARAWDALWASIDAGAAVLEPGVVGLEGRRRSPREPRRGRLPGADVRARPPARPLGARRRHASSHRAGIATARRRSASSKRETSSRSSTAPRCRAAATSASRRTCSSPRTGSSGSRRRSASSGSSPPRRAPTQRAAPRPRSDRATRRALQRRCRSGR